MKVAAKKELNAFEHAKELLLWENKICERIKELDYNIHCFHAHDSKTLHNLAQYLL